MASKFIFHADETRDFVERSLVEFLQKLPRNKAWAIEVKQHKKDRTDAQNAALFGVAYPCFKGLGFSPDEIHEFMCMRFFGTIERELLGRIIVKPYRTTTRNERGDRDVIDTERFSRFYEMVQQVGAEAGIYVPDPEKQQPNYLSFNP